MTLDKRLNAFRPDLADESLRGQVEAEHFVQGKPMRIADPVVDVRGAARGDAGVTTQFLFGDDVLVFEDSNGWCWVQNERDGYVGYVVDTALDKRYDEPTHIVIAPRTFVYPGSDLKFPPTNALSMGSLVTIKGGEERRGTLYGILPSGEAIIAKHLVPIDEVTDDHVAVAETLMHTPYLWGGVSGFGIDCSGLVQLSLLMTGQSVLRDSDMQADTIGDAIEPDAHYNNLKRGDFVFWKGHAAMMASHSMLLHASGHTMSVTLEPLHDAIERIAYLYGKPTVVRRL
ncbi:NlpC/P60 family protein [Phyllobacterium myrsinacearum]|uniref:Peptidase P60 n=1 Tax=Phyllobacterium myrsinacearum TaxID=28101 RepID=A0A2S9JCN4_9HYPH|nr:peptidase P60 [Phyllobacterium myrsinacearum]PWV94883.1 NlpC/P60 family protein [Phyllobacterium myrsinacearum]RZV07006.1 NlpC/P60 family protein [Phyllobacterium myrsinacearum]